MNGRWSLPTLQQQQQHQQQQSHLFARSSQKMDCILETDTVDMHAARWSRRHFDVTYNLYLYWRKSTRAVCSGKNKKGVWTLGSLRSHFRTGLKSSRTFSCLLSMLRLCSSLSLSFCVWSSVYVSEQCRVCNAQYVHCYIFARAKSCIVYTLSKIIWMFLPSFVSTPPLSFAFRLFYLPVSPLAFFLPFSTRVLFLSHCYKAAPVKQYRAFWST